MIFLNNHNDFFMSKDYSADQGGSYSKGANGASNADSGVDENGSGVVGSASSSPYFCSEHFEESPRDSTDEISNPSAFTPFVRKSLGGKVDASDSQAGQKRKKSESPGNGGGASNEEGVFKAVRSRVSKGGGLGGVGGISSNGAKGASSSSNGGVQNPDGGFSAGRIRSSSVGGSSSNGAGATNRAGEATSLSPFDTSPILPSQDKSDQSKADLAKARKLEKKIVEARRVENLDPFWESLNDKPRKLRSTTKADSSKIDMPVDASWKSVNQSQEGQNPRGGFSAFRSRSSNAGGLGGFGGSYSNGGVGGVDYRESGASVFKMFQRDDEFLRGVENLEHLHRDSRGINQSPASHQQEAPLSPTASSSSSMPSSLTPSESPASTFGSSGLGGVNNQPNNAMGG